MDITQESFTSPNVIVHLLSDDKSMKATPQSKKCDHTSYFKQKSGGKNHIVTFGTRHMYMAPWWRINGDIVQRFIQLKELLDIFFSKLNSEHSFLLTLALHTHLRQFQGRH